MAIVGVSWKAFHPAHRDAVLTPRFISFQMLSTDSSVRFSIFLPFLLSCSWMNTPPIKSEVEVPLVCFFPLPMVTPGETPQFPPAILVVSFLSYTFHWWTGKASLAGKVSILLQHNKRLKENEGNKLYFINCHSSPWKATNLATGRESVRFDAQDHTALKTKDQNLYTMRKSFLNPGLNEVWV